MYAIETNEVLGASVSPGGTLTVPVPVLRGEQTVMEPTRIPYRMIENMTAERRAELGIVPIIIDPTPDTSEVEYTQSGPTKIDGQWRITYETSPKDPAPYVAMLRTDIDNAAEGARSAFITQGAGQALTYQRKLEEARAYQNNPAGDFPLLSASVGPDGANLAEVAATVIATSAAWSQLAAAIEAIRLHGKMRVGQGATIGAKRAVAGLATGALGRIANPETDPQTIPAIMAECLAAMAQAAP